MAEVKDTTEVCRDIIALLKGAKKALLNYDSKNLSKVSNYTIHCTGLFQSQRALYVAIIAYALSKIVEKGAVDEKQSGVFDDFINGIAENIGAAAEFIEGKNFKKFDDALKSIIEEISEFDKSFSKYIQEIIEFAKVQKGANISEHGISLSSVAKITGVSKWDLMKKVSETKVYEKKESAAVSPRERLTKAKKILGAK